MVSYAWKDDWNPWRGGGFASVSPWIKPCSGKVMYCFVSTNFT